MNPENSSSGKDLKSTDSQIDGESDFLEVGYIRRPHGVHGEILVDIKEDLVHLINIGQVLLLGDNKIELTLISIRNHKNGYLLMFEEIDAPEDVGQHRFEKFFIPGLARQMQLTEGEFYEEQILGLKVLTDDGIFLGSIGEIIKTGANDVYVVNNSDGDILLPAISEVIKNIDIEKQEMLVHIIPGLMNN